MRFIVDVYRLIILAFMAIVLTAGAYLIAMVMMESGSAGWTAATTFAFLAVLIAIVIAIGITATFISMHDRMCEIADHSRRMAESLEWANRNRYEVSERP